ncbi:CPBP family intramembrane glutamic endopeptidase [Ectobacillus panaciterrae]|uniref:CPBP family intramembrane glutamic endopeptidase n=1 Tax=Ectobacillus panaciterrae TaxID=363872 RepID=UPI0003FA58A0|nr:type II CAAX endopeptidase family protein [Ectobacillus panaciterrae]
MSNQQEKLNAMTDRELRLNLYITQGIILFVSGVLSYWLFGRFSAMVSLFQWEPAVIVGLGGAAAFLIVFIDYIAIKMLPESWFDDGGVNDRIFRGISISHLAAITLLIGFAEELLFRGIIQTHFGLGYASILFAVLHIRYIKKPFLFVFVLLISISFGYLFAWTGNLLVTIFAHFLVDFIMGLHLRGETKDEDV